MSYAVKHVCPLQFAIWCIEGDYLQGYKWKE